MSVSRLSHISPIGVEQMALLADALADPEVLRLENLDTDLPPPPEALSASLAAITRDDANSYLPFLGQNELRQLATQHVNQTACTDYDWKTESLISAGGLSGITNCLLALLEPGDGVLMTDPIYIGLINRVRLAGGVPHFVPLQPHTEGWRLDVSALASIDPQSIKVMLLMSPSMPTGAVFNPMEWDALLDFCRQSDAWILLDTAMERILFDGLSVFHPARRPGFRNRVITVGAASKEFRMIGWRVGWVVGPARILADVARVSISNVVCQTGIAMPAVAAAFKAGSAGIPACVAEWQARRDILMEQLYAFQLIRPLGGWSLLWDTRSLGLSPEVLSKRLLERGKVAATPMTGWGPSGQHYLRLVFSNEPIGRLSGLRERIQRVLGNVQS
ncbi:MAG: pyridoxal phosphate-dependent aminotransferase [Acidobacteria bacterium]|nr:pyridoxal phosphate-dependent aminotransferase [Acidobacteriota bacterium]MCB9398336.1 pyridoxal phosphate-dependent aminotransferase [Acidobacteriota bacterium]